MTGQAKRLRWRLVPSIVVRSVEIFRPDAVIVGAAGAHAYAGAALILIAAGDEDDTVGFQRVAHVDRGARLAGPLAIFQRLDCFDGKSGMSCEFLDAHADHGACAAYLCPCNHAGNLAPLRNFSSVCERVERLWRTSSAAQPHTMPNSR